MEKRTPELRPPGYGTSYGFFWTKENTFVWSVSTDGLATYENGIFEIGDDNRNALLIASDINYVNTDGSKIYFTKNSDSDLIDTIFAYDVKTNETHEYYTVANAQGSINYWIVKDNYLYIEFEDEILRVDMNTNRSETLVSKAPDRFHWFSSYLTNSFNGQHFYYCDNASLYDLNLENNTVNKLLAEPVTLLALIGNILYYYSKPDAGEALGSLQGLRVN
jgi:hypothetical protein